MEKYRCLICNREMEGHHKLAYEDHACKWNLDHHSLSLRIVNDFWMDGSIQMKTPRMTKLRIAFYKEHLHLKIHYDEKYSEIWARSNSAHRIRINQIVVPNFSDIEKLKNKIKTLLVFG